MTEHPELRKGRHCLFIPIKDTNAGKKLNTAAVSRWILHHLVDSHATLQNSKCIPGKVKAHEVRAVVLQADCICKTDPVRAAERSWRFPPRLVYFSILFVSLGIPSYPAWTQADGIFICGSLFMVAALEPEQADCPPLSIKLWFYLICQMNYSNYL